MPAFNWQKDAAAIVVEEQPRTAVYTNEVGTIVLRQERYPEADDTVFILPACAVPIAAGILRAAGLEDLARVASGEAESD